MRASYFAMIVLMLTKYVSSQCCVIYLYRTQAGQNIRLKEKNNDPSVPKTPERNPCVKGGESKFIEDTAYRAVVPLSSTACAPAELIKHIVKEGGQENKPLTTAFYALYEVHTLYIAEKCVAKPVTKGQKDVNYKIDFSKGVIDDTNGCLFGSFEPFNEWVDDKALSFKKKGFLTKIRKAI